MKRYVKQPPKPKPTPKSSKRVPIDILTAMADPHLFGNHFKSKVDWGPWKAFLSTMFGIPLTPEQRKLYQQCTGRSNPDPDGHREVYVVAGRGAGKSFVALSLTAVYLAVFRDWRPHLGVGERGTIMIIAQDRAQARVCFRFVYGLLYATPMLRALITGKTRERIDLSNRITIEVHAASMRSTRGYSICCALLDELAFWSVDEFSAEPDVEILAALRPGLDRVPGSMLLCASSPYGRKGVLWDAFRKHFAKEGDPVLVWKAPTKVMRPSYDQKKIDAAILDDPARFNAEYMAEFRVDIESFVLRGAVEACISDKVIERKPEPGVSYFGFVDPSGGSADDMSLSIAHYDHATQNVIIDLLRWFKPPFSPEIVVREFTTTLKNYNINTVVGDKYAGEWPREQFGKFNVRYDPSAKTKSELYTDLLPLVNSARIQLLDIPKCNNQLLSLERRTARGGKDSVDHPSGHHDDLINAVAGAASVATAKQVDLSLSWVEGPTVDLAAEARQFRVARFLSHVGYR